jgi:hypothetical protein
MQINDSTTAFLSGSNDPRGILTFDWTTMEYTKHSSQLSGDRQYSACALLKGENGENLVAVASGRSSGMEVWNPVDGTVKNLTSDFPLYSGYNRTPRMVSVGDGSELIFYESVITNNPAKGVWKYHLSNNTWTQLGEMIEGRDDFAVLPVQGVSCP